MFRAPSCRRRSSPLPLGEGWGEGFATPSNLSGWTSDGHRRAAGSCFCSFRSSEIRGTSPCSPLGRAPEGTQRKPDWTATAARQEFSPVSLSAAPRRHPVAVVRQPTENTHPKNLPQPRQRRQEYSRVVLSRGALTQPRSQAPQERRVAHWVGSCSIETAEQSAGIG